LILLPFRSGLIAFITFRSGCFWCEAGAADPSSDWISRYSRKNQSWRRHDERRADQHWHHGGHVGGLGAEMPETRYMAAFE
jgi:hypothetical protein